LFFWQPFIFFSPICLCRLFPASKYTERPFAEKEMAVVIGSSKCMRNVTTRYFFCTFIVQKAITLQESNDYIYPVMNLLYFSGDPSTPPIVVFCWQLQFVQQIASMLALENFRKIRNHLNDCLTTELRPSTVIL